MKIKIDWLIDFFPVEHLFLNFFYFKDASRPFIKIIIYYLDWRYEE